ncbi:thioredoxin family protein [Roseomonas eburnea]|uniref:Thioredoxin family protein n=1 Tax=Neoroseomonas eburnea TaxID=1346889 RepID=A0A9X9XG27_9PROT|nr:thioredoxin family protein [Neoroseomonas eburnea]MBR0682663.1 thioredoxin family protein [Neoroseomonas eburnea]
MKDVKVLGPGCAKCKATAEVIAAVAKESGAAVTLSKVEDMREIVGYGVMSTPAVVVDGKVVHAGSVPARAQVQGWLA